jgi:hypothetical protein
VRYKLPKLSGFFGQPHFEVLAVTSRLWNTGKARTATTLPFPLPQLSRSGNAPGLRDPLPLLNSGWSRQALYVIQRIAAFSAEYDRVSSARCNRGVTSPNGRLL